MIFVLRIPFFESMLKDKQLPNEKHYDSGNFGVTKMLVDRAFSGLCSDITPLSGMKLPQIIFMKS